MTNQGFDPKEIELLKKECKAEGSTFIYCEDENDDMEMSDSGEIAHFQFIGKYEGQEVIYDAIIYTLRLHHSGLVYEKALEEIRKTFPKYKAVDERDETYKSDPAMEEEAEILITEVMEMIEDEEDIKVAEHVDIDTEFDFGVGLDICLNVEDINDEVIEDFIEDFNSGKIKLDPTLYSFTSLEDEE